jgi:hypothetical protein
MRGWIDEAGQFLSSIGISQNTITATARAYASPTLANIRAVEAAFQAEGASPPPELMDALYKRYYDTLRTSPYMAAGTLQSGLAAILPWAAAGILILMLVRRKR